MTHQPTPIVVVCSTALVTQTSDLHPYGEATHMINVNEGFESLVVGTSDMPDPTAFGAAFDTYVFSLTDFDGNVFIVSPMARVTTGTTPGNWAGIASLGVKTIPNGTVTVSPYQEATKSLGPTLLKGELICDIPAS